MLSKIFYPFKELPRLEQKDKTGYEFEVQLFRSIKKQLADTSVKVIRSDQSGDQGKDVILYTKEPISLFGVEITKKCQKQKIFVEIKSTSKKTLAHERIGKNVGQIAEDAPDIFVLITNATISPYSYYTLESDLKKNNIKFILIDTYIFYTVPTGRIKETDKINVVYQTGSSTPPNTLYVSNKLKDINIYFLLRNPSSKLINAKLLIKNNEEWGSEALPLKLIIASGMSKCLKITTKPSIRALSDKVGLIVQMERQSHTFYLKLPNFDAGIKFEYSGAKNLKIRQKIISSVERFNANKPLLIHLTGEAGVGKTRMIEEIIEAFRGKTPEFFTFSFTYKRNTFDFNQILKAFLGESNHFNSIEAIFDRFKIDLRFPIIIFEDLHYAETNFLNSLKNIVIKNNSQGQYILIVTGRNDYSVINTSYYNFIDICQSSPSDNIRLFCIEPLTSNECKHIITDLIQKVPEKALKKIQRTTANIPFNIIQLIQHIFEKKLIQVINRNTYGIPNPEEFSNKGIPETMEEVLQARMDSLGRIKSGEVRVFLLALAIWGKEVEYHDIYQYWGEDHTTQVISELITRKFVKSNNDRFILFHDNLLNFCRKIAINNELHRVAKIYMKWPIGLKYLDNFEKGRLYNAINKKMEALECYKEILQAVDSSETFTAENLPSLYFEFLEDLQKLASKTKLSIRFQEKILLAKVYIAVHHLSLKQAMETCRWAIEFLKGDNKIPKDRKRYLELFFKQQEAHALQNMGQLFPAKRLMQEVELTIQIKKIDAFEIIFDLYDRMQDLYFKFNHKKLSNQYNQLSFQLISCATKYQKIIWKILAETSKAQRIIYTNPIESLRRYKQALEYSNKNNGPKRNSLHIELCILILKTLLNSKKKEKIDHLISKTELILKESLSEDYTYSITRSQLLLATLFFLKDKKDLRLREISRTYINKGFDSSLMWGTGTFYWQLWNLLAVLDAYEQKSLEEIFKDFNTAYECLISQGLFWLGDGSFCNPNLLVLYNYYKFIRDNMLTKDLELMLNEVYTYDSASMKKESRRMFNKKYFDSLPQLFNNALYEQDTKYYLAII